MFELLSCVGLFVGASRWENQQKILKGQQAVLEAHEATQAKFDDARISRELKVQRLQRAQIQHQRVKQSINEAQRRAWKQNEADARAASKANYVN